MRAAAATVALLVVLSLVSIAQGPPGVPGSPAPGLPAPGSPVPGAPAPGGRGLLPPRDPTSAPRTGTAVIRGRVVALDNGRPLRRVQVRATAPGAAPGGAPGGYSTMTDELGRFEIAELPAARYTLTATKGGYVTLSLGQRRPFEPGRPLDLAEGQVFDSASFSLPRGSVITGRVLDEFGDPVTGAQVQAARYRYVNGQRALAPVTSVGSPFGLGTDDRGEFRLFGLPPGEYFVSASIQMPAPGTPNAAQIAYAPTYFPGTVSPAAAQVVAIGIGEERTGITIQMVPARMATLSGVVVDAGGRPVPRTGLSLRQTLGGGTGVSSRGAGTTRDDGSFSIPGVTPGEYNLDARAAGNPALDASAGTLAITVTGEDMTGLFVTMTPGVAARGRITGADGRPLQGLRTSDVRVSTQAFPASMGFLGGGTPTIADDWTFVAPNLQGERHIRVTPPPDWTLRRVTHLGQDVTDRPLDLSRGPVEGLVIELTQQLTSLGGTVRDARGAEVRDYVVVAFADDPDRWRPPSRYIHTARPDQSGVFEIRSLPPGQYVLVALEYLEEGEETNPAVLGRLRRSPAGTNVSLREGESRTLEVRLGDGQ